MFELVVKKMIKWLLLLLTLTGALGKEPEKCAVVTGASGFVAGHIVEILLEKGYIVHGTVRSISSPNCDFLRQLNQTHPGTIHLFQADLLADRPFDQATKGCDKFFHVASSVLNTDSNQHQVDTAVKGTISALNAAKEAGVKAVVVTSSVASIAPTKRKSTAETIPYDVNDHNDIAAIDYGTYAYSKVQAEKAGNEFLKKHHNPFRLATIHFPFALGPQQNTRVTSSNKAIEHLLVGELPYFCIPLKINHIDVRDVARAHVHVMESQKASGRYIVALSREKSTWTLDQIAKILVTKYPDYPIATRSLPLSIYQYLHYVDPRLTKYDVDSRMKRKHPGYDGSRLVKELGFEYKYRDLEETVYDAAASMIKYGIADGTAQPLPLVTNLAMATACAFVVLVAWLGGLFSTKPAPKPKDE